MLSVYSANSADWSKISSLAKLIHAVTQKWFIYIFARSAGAVEYTDFFSAKEYDPHNEWPGYDTKQSDGEAAVMLEV